MADTKVQRGNTAVFVARIAGCPATEVSWYKDGEQLSASEHVRLAEHSPCFYLSLINTGSTDEGVYTCTARNEGGEVSCKAQLTVETGHTAMQQKETGHSAVKKGKRRSLQLLYEIHEEIGRGSFGVVKRVTNRESGESLAAKFLPLQRGSRSRAFQERDLLARVTHPRVACLLDSFCSRQTLVLLTELCSSQSLLDHLLLKVTVKEREVKLYIQQVLEGIDHIHRMNVLHLDINPANILMTLSGKEEVKICDFGFSQEVDSYGDQYSKFGTPEFVAPEIVCQSPVTKAADIWSLGVLSYLCLTCHCPFSGESDRATLLSVREGRVSWDTPEVISRSHQARDLLHRILQLDPKLRPTAAECLEHEWFQRFHEDQGPVDINTKNLKCFISRSKLQRALTCYGSALKLQPIAELLEAPARDTSMASPPSPQHYDSPSFSGGSSSDYDEVEAWATPLPISIQQSPHEDGEKDHLETENQISDKSVFSEIPSTDKQIEMEVLGRQVTPDPGSLSAELARGSPDVPGRLTRGDSTSSLGTDDEASTGGRIPRESVIKSTFYSSSEELSPLSARRMMLRQKKRTKRPERSRARLRSTLSGRLGEPLLEDMEDSGEEDTARSQRRGSSQSSAPLTKSCSFDSEPILCSNIPTERRSRSLDEHMRMTTSELQESGKDVEETGVINSQEVSGHDKYTALDVLSEQATESADTVMDNQDAVELHSTSHEKDKVHDEAADVEMPQLTVDPSTEVILQYVENDMLYLSDENRPMAASGSSPEVFDEGQGSLALDTGIKEDVQKVSHCQSDSKEHSPLKPVFVECMVPVSAVQDVSEIVSSRYGLELLERTRSMDLSFKGLETLDVENRAHFLKIYKAKSDDVIHKRSDSALLATEPTEKAHSTICGISACTEAHGFKSHSPKELDTPVTATEVFSKKADSTQEIFLCAPQDKDPHGSLESFEYSIRESDTIAPGSKEDYGIVETAEEAFPGILEDQETCAYLASSQSSLTNLLDRNSEEAYFRAKVHPAHSQDLPVYAEERHGNLEELLFEKSSGKASPYINLESCEDEEAEQELRDILEKIHTYESHHQSGRSSSEMPVEGLDFLAKSGSLKALYGSTDLEEELERYTSTPELEAKPLPGKSGRLMGFFRRQSWTSQSSSTIERVVRRQVSEGDSTNLMKEQQQKTDDLSITKRMKASVSSFSKVVMGRQSSREDKKEGAGTRSSPPFPRGKSPEAGAVSPKRTSGLFPFKLPAFKRNKEPVFVEELIDQAVSLGQEVTLWCRLTGHPPPEIHWYKEARRLKTTDRIRLSVIDRDILSLTIYSAKEEDLGSYRCVAINTMGHASTSCTLIVSELPTFPTSLQAIQLQGDAVLLVWRPVESITELTYCIQYSRNGEGWRLLEEGVADSCYRVSNLASGAEYVFRVACLNRAGIGPFSQPSAPFSIGTRQEECLAPLIYMESLGPGGLTEQTTLPFSPRPKTYSFLSEINRGRFSVVKQCREDLSGQLFAAKITPFKPHRRQWALREYLLLKRLSHAHLVQLHAAFIGPRHLVLILDLCTGRELLYHLAERDLYGEMHVQAILQQILSVAHYLHRRRVAHLDLRSDNVLVTDQGQLKVVDLGSARTFIPGQPIFTERLQEYTETRAPEILEGQGVGPETDIWAIGVLAFVMLSANDPYRSDVHHERDRRVRKAKVHLGRCYSGLSEGALGFVKKTLSNKPQARPSAAECLQLPWIHGARQASKHRVAVVCFTTDKLRAYLQEQEPRRQYGRAKMEVPLLE
ncbi:obscurin-like [Megalops cyprinoides]|uniref:obscurin-like n=1 Tax=Megalops cyprinoides TaxID=118141 RepID=UPI00186485D2|nr:obscurin-like [Megalops cyprinoides]